jgi:L-lysine exporter family protein LysE/ArgO
MMLGACKATLPPGSDAWFILGFASASVLWFHVVGTLVSLLGSRINEKVLTWVNRICGAVIIFYGLKLLYSFVKLMGWL